MDLEERLIANKAKGMYFVVGRKSTKCGWLIRDEKGWKGSWFWFHLVCCWIQQH